MLAVTLIFSTTVATVDHCGCCRQRRRRRCHRLCRRHRECHSCCYCCCVVIHQTWCKHIPQSNVVHTHTHSSLLKHSGRKESGKKSGIVKRKQKNVAKKWAKHKQNPNIASKYILCYEPIVFCSISSQIESYGIAHHRQAAKHCTAHFLKRLCVYDSTLFNAFSLRNMLPV